MAMVAQVVDGFSHLAAIPKLTAADVNELRRELMVGRLVTNPREFAERMCALSEWALAELAKGTPQAMVVVPKKKKASSRVKSVKPKDASASPAEPAHVDVPVAPPVESEPSAPVADESSPVEPRPQSVGSQESSYNEGDAINCDAQLSEGTEEERRVGPLGMTSEELRAVRRTTTVLQKQIEDAQKASNA